MSTKKTTPEKLYLVVDSDDDIIAYGPMDEVMERIDDYRDTDEDDEVTFEEWLTQCTIYELGAGKKIKYTPAKFEVK